MDEASISQALDRIEAALARVEAASQKAARARHEHADLSQRHERLKATVSQSLGELDALLARRGP